MQVLWDHGPSTVQEIQQRMSGRLEESSIRTFLAILQRKGRVTRGKESRAFRYRASIDRDVARRGAIRHLIGGLFSDPADLALNIIRTGALDEAELRRLRQAILAEERRAG